MKILRTLEKIYVVISLLFLANGLLPRAIAEDDPTARWQPDIGYRIGQLIVYSILVPLLLVHWRKILRGLLHSSWIVALCALAIISASWSNDIRFTLFSGISLSAMTLFGVYIATCFEWDEQLTMFGWLSVIAVAGSILMAIFVPAYGISHDLHSGAVKGLFPNKNIMARQMVFAILIFALGKPKQIPAWLRHTSLAGACILLLLANAATALVTLLACIVTFPVLYLVRLPRKKTLPLWVPLTPVFAVGILAVITNYSLLAEAVGRNSTLTGRVPLWNAVLEAIGEKPWLGYGFNIFWKREPGALAKIFYTVHFQAAHAHDGYLDILLAMGVVGLLVFIGGLITNFWRAGEVFRSGEIPGAKWPLIFLVSFAIFNVTESAILRPMSFLWIPYVIVYVSLALLKTEEAHAPAPEPSREIVGNGNVEADRDGGHGGIVPGYGV
jgi:exopolysaccharide production protein ExoQ